MEKRNSIIDNLKKFNRKERFYLVGHALGNDDFVLSESFRNKISNALGITIPTDAFVAMDYHLDWLYASIYLFMHENDGHLYSRKSETITANQEDIDLLIAYEENGKTHLVMLEAKGVIPFSNSQLESKAIRFNSIITEDALQTAPVIPHFAIISPFMPSKINYAVFPAWMKHNNTLQWIELTPLKEKLNNKELFKIVRCNDNKKPDQNGSHWMVENER